jgi:uncharacterized protein (DUF488 family)
MIFWRQKVLLSVLKTLPDTAVSKIRMMKLLFLLKEKERVDRYGGFYDFLPYKYGPFSFLVYRDIAELERLGLVKSDDKSVRYIGPQKQGAEEALISPVQQCVRRTIQQYGKLSQRTLLKIVYQEFPWYASRTKLNSTHTDNKKPHLSGIHTIGYQGLSIDGLLNTLLKRGIRAVIDTRNVPFSHKYGFSKLHLQKRCQELGFDYYHFPDVGIPPQMRHSVRNLENLWAVYKKTILPKAKRSVKEISTICDRSPTVFVCFEGAPGLCHRSILAREIASVLKQPIFHYKADEEKWVKE